MLSAGFLAMPGGPELLICGVLVLLPVVIVLAIVGLTRGTRQEGSEEDRRRAQEIYTDLEKLEKRVETLETILLDRVKER